MSTSAAPQPVGQFVYQVYVNGTLYKDSAPQDVSLAQGWGSHDIFSMRIDYPRLHANPNAIAMWPDNAPVKVVWGRKPANVATWYGYVNHHENANPSDTGLGAFQTTYYMIGTSKPMNTDVHRTWGAVTPTYIAKTIANKHGLRAVLSPSNWLLPNETQAGESDFNFLNRLANKTGHRFWVSGGTLYFTDPAAVLTSAGNATGVPVFRQDKTFWQSDTMRRFREMSGDNLPGSSVTQRQVFGITANNQVIAASAAGAGGSLANIKSSRHVTTPGEAGQIVNAWQNMAQFWRGAQAELYGNVMVYPGKLANLQGTWLPGNASGHWIVASARHALKSAYTTDTSSDWYVTETTLLRNTSGQVPAVRPASGVRPEAVPMNLIAGKWQSSNRGVIYHG